MQLRRPPASCGRLRAAAAAAAAGLGVVGKRADLRWRRTPEQVEQLEGLQDQLLEAAARLVRPGGLLVYATCSIEPSENQERCAACAGAGGRAGGWRAAASCWPGVRTAARVAPGRPGAPGGRLLSRPAALARRGQAPGSPAAQLTAHRSPRARRVSAFLRRHPHFSLEAAPAGLLPHEVLDAAGRLVLLPFRHGVDGAFAARLRRAG
jgi:16S rRNA C967 or C1407 C5-methylase (RsmB/RsmF family)